MGMNGNRKDNMHGNYRHKEGYKMKEVEGSKVYGGRRGLTRAFRGYDLF
jgi:hypothetical protein